MLMGSLFFAGSAGIINSLQASSGRALAINWEAGLGLQVGRIDANIKEYDIAFLKIWKAIYEDNKVSLNETFTEVKEMIAEDINIPDETLTVVCRTPRNYLLETFGKTVFPQNIQMSPEERAVFRYCIASMIKLKNSPTLKLFELLKKDNLSADARKKALSNVNDVDIDAKDESAGGELGNLSSQQTKSQLCGTLLHHAAGRGYYDLVKALLAKGAKVNETDILNNTPLHWAIGQLNDAVNMCNRQEIENAINTINMLIEREDIDLKVVNANSHTPLDFICYGVARAISEKDKVSLKEIFTIAKKLIARGANISDGFLEGANNPFYLGAYAPILFKHSMGHSRFVNLKMSTKGHEIFKDFIDLIQQWIELKATHPEIYQLEESIIKRSEQL
jgi:hypothetical protein